MFCLNEHFRFKILACQFRLQTQVVTFVLMDETAVFIEDPRNRSVCAGRWFKDTSVSYSREEKWKWRICSSQQSTLFFYDDKAWVNLE